MAGVAAIAGALGGAAADPEGLCGRNLLEAVRAGNRPSAYASSIGQPGGVWEAFRATDMTDRGTVSNIFSAESYRFPDDGYSPPAQMEATAITPLEWWGLTINDESPAARDLHNLRPSPAGTSASKGTYPPGIVSAAVFDNGVWKAGGGMVEGTEISCFQPPAGLEGDVARATLYMISIYPCEFWRNLGENFLSDNPYPILQPWARRLLLAWHQSDPPDEAERRRNAAVAAIQGNRNPYIDQPSLVEHIWGDKSGDPFTPETPDTPTRTPLKGRYSINDERIDLYSPYIPDDASWSVDGQPVAGKELSPSQLGAGTHELRFSAEGINGKIKIVIE